MGEGERGVEMNSVWDTIAELSEELDKLRDKLHQIKTWVDAYPLDMFPEPDFKKAAKVLKENGMTLDAISASNMRHVLDGIRRIIEK